ncbi:CHAP domain-containing protein [Methylobacterium oryzihabitans]|uniref:CHAP domain-containing protein n=1 Tax=Methylobacterium oryzihabitans TaxID=2499852 RepID=A0A437PA17_9HYPH|nr:CHAP domain-containing protein [Methylobacterium oryzihabitans]RVU19132.1 CHAP domain-containing protein [Methylobacterium oryzihabitans]
MARAPYRGVELTEALRPVASPVDTFVTAQAPSRDTNLQDLARSLSGLGGSLQSFVQKRDAEAEEADRLRGEAAFYSQTEQGFAAGVASDAVPAQSSPAFLRGFKQAQGNVAGGQLQEQLAAAYDAWPEKTSTDPNAFNGFLTGFLKDKIKTQDGDVLRGLLPHVRQASANLQQRHIGDVSRAAKEGFATALSARGEQVLDAADTAGLASKKGTDYVGAFGELEAIRADGLKKGLSETDLDTKLIDTVTTAAITKRDPKLLGFLDRKVPGKDYTWANTPYGRDQRQKTIDTLETMGRRSIQEDEKRRREEKAAAKDDVTRDTILAITKDPRAPLPEALLARGEKVDPDFRINAIRWRDEVGKGERTSDPEALLAVTTDIINGGGLQRVQQGIRDGVFRNRADLEHAFKFAEGMKTEGPKLEEMLRVGTAKTIIDTLKKQTAVEKDASKLLFDDGSMSREGLQATSDYKQALMSWLLENPRATSLEREKAAQTIGAAFLDRLKQPEGPMSTTYYDRTGLDTANTFGAAAPPGGSAPVAAQAPAPGDTPQGRVPPPPPRGTVTRPNPLAPPPQQPAPQPGGLPAVDDFGRPLEAVQPAAPSQPAGPAQGQPQATTAPAPALPVAPQARPAAPPAAAPATPAPTSEAAQGWFQGLAPETRAALEQMATAQKKPLPAVVDDAFRRAVAAGRVKAPVAPAAPALGRQSEGPRAPDGTPIEPASLPSSPKTEEVGRAFSRAIEGAYVGSVTSDGTSAIVNGHTFTGTTTPDQVARRFEGFGEANPQHRQALTAFLSKSAGQTIDPVKVPWCAAFVDAVLDASGKTKRGSLRAVDFLDYGTGTAQPTRGDVVVFKSMAAGSTGHVGFVVGIEGDRVRYIAGNDDNRVQEDTLPLSKVAGFRRPPEAGTPTAFAPSREVAERFASVLGATAQPAGGYASRELQADPRAARILDFVAGPESGGNYNAVFGNAGATEDLSKRTLDQTIAWSRDRGTASSATGRFQFMAGTLEGLKKELGLSGREAFTPELQDRMALALLNRRGYRDFATGKLGTEDFANELAKEWAALPNFTTGRSHYAGDGVNKALVSPSQVRAALEGTGAFPGSRLARAAQTLTSAVSGSGVAGRIRGMFSRPAALPSTPPASDPYANAPAGQAARLRETNPDPVGNSETVLAQVPPQLAEVIRKAQSDNPRRRFVVVRSGDGEGAEVYPVDAEGRVVFEPGQQQAAMSAIRLAADQLGVGVNLQGLREGRPRVALAQTRRA